MALSPVIVFLEKVLSPQNVSLEFLLLFVIQALCDTKLFNVWLGKILIPELKPGQVIIMDNAAFHKAQQSQKIIEKAGCEILFLPPYSPDLNPIEVFWANFKRLIKSNLKMFSTLAQTIDHAFLTVCRT